MKLTDYDQIKTNADCEMTFLWGDIWRCSDMGRTQQVLETLFWLFDSSCWRQVVERSQQLFGMETTTIYIETKSKTILQETSRLSAPPAFTPVKIERSWKVSVRRLWRQWSLVTGSASPVTSSAYRVIDEFYDIYHNFSIVSRWKTLEIIPPDLPWSVYQEDMILLFPCQLTNLILYRYIPLFP